MKIIPLVCIIDDDDIFQYANKKLLESTGKVDGIIQFKDGEEALNYFLEHKDREEMIPDLVFLDLNMPYMDGWQFLDAFTANTFKKRIITIYICTSSNSSSDLEKFKTYPKLKGYLIKPVSKDAVFEAIDLELSI